MLGNTVDLDDGTIGLEGKVPADLAEFTDRLHHLTGIEGEPMARVDGQSPRLQLAEKLLHPLRER